MPGMLVDVPEIVLFLFQPFHGPEGRQKGSSSGSIPMFFVCLAMHTQVTAVTKLHVPVWLLHSSSCISKCSGDAGVHVHVQPGESRFVLLIIINFYLPVIF